MRGENYQKKQSDKKDNTGNVDNDNFLNQNVSIIIPIMILVIIANLFELKSVSSAAFGHVFEEL